MSDSDLSSLSSAESIETDEELLSTLPKAGTLDAYLKNGARSTSATSPPSKKKRPASPPHEYVLADNPDIAFIVMFRSRFNGAFPKSLPHYGPQDIEKGIVGSLPDEHVERLLCALIGLVLNRKKDVERGHFQRALEEAVQVHNNQWPAAWAGKNPLHGGGNFNTMSPEQRLTLLKALILWSLHSSDAVQAIVKESYKQQRHEDDLNQPLSIQPWGRDSDKRRYWLIEGQDDTHFRLYRESNPALKHNTWRSVAGTIDELKVVAEKLGDEGSQAARRLCEGIRVAIPRFELSEDKRKRRDYRNARKAQFTRPEPGYPSLYEGRTRGKRIRYTYSDEEEGGSDALYSRRSNRQSGISTPAESAGSTFTASGRQVKSRVGGLYGESRLSGGHSHEAEAEARTSGADAMQGMEEVPTTRTRSLGATRIPRSRGGRKHIEGYNVLDEMEDESDASMSGGEWDGGDDDDIDDNVVDDEEDEDADMSESGESEDELVDELASRPSLVVSLRYPKPPAALGSTGALEPKDTVMMNGFASPSQGSASTVNGEPKPIANGEKRATSDYRSTNLHQISSADSHPILPVTSAGVLSG